jgi:hypothetical protein
VIIAAASHRVVLIGIGAALCVFGIAAISNVQMLVRRANKGTFGDESANARALRVFRTVQKLCVLPILAGVVVVSIALS